VAKLDLNIIEPIFCDPAYVLPKYKHCADKLMSRTDLGYFQD